MAHTLPPDTDQSCELYPIALSLETLDGVAPGTELEDISNGVRPGNFGWLIWSVRPSIHALAKSLTPPGDSDSYVNPDNHSDHVVSLGDFVRGKPGISDRNIHHHRWPPRHPHRHHHYHAHFSHRHLHHHPHDHPHHHRRHELRRALNALMHIDAIVPVWDETRRHGHNVAYRVGAFAKIRLVDYNLAARTISVRFLGYVTCDDVNEPPQVDAGPDQDISTQSAALNGSVSDDGLPAPGILSIAWSQISGPGTATFADAASAATSVTFDESGFYILQLEGDDGELTGSDTVAITVSSGNNPPVALDDSATVDEGGTVTVLESTATSVLANDTDPEDDPLTAILVAAPANGAVTLNPDGTFSYTHNGTETTSDSFTYRANDGSLDSADATVTITINPVNDALIALDDSAIVDEGGTVTILDSTATSVLANDTDAENDTLTAILVAAPANGVVTLNPDGTFSYTHNGTETTSDSFTYRANDGSLDSGDATVTITINPVNDAPTITSTPITDADEGVLYTYTLTFADVDPGDVVAASPALSVIPPFLTLTDNGNNTAILTGTPANGDSGAHGITLVVEDLASANATQVFTITVANSINNAPTANDQNLTSDEDTFLNITLTANDPDGDPLTFEIVNAPQNGLLTGLAPEVIYIPNAHFNGPDSFSFRVSDGEIDSNTAIVSIDILSIEDAPAASQQSVTTRENTPVSITLAGFDGDNDPLSFTVVSLPVSGELSVSGVPITAGDLPHTLAGDTLDYTPALDFTGSDSFNFFVNDGQSNSPEATVSIDILDSPPLIADAGEDFEVNLLDFSTMAGEGRVLVSSDEWQLTNQAFALLPDDARQLAENVALWFSGGQPGSFLAHTDNRAFNESEIAQVMFDEGHQWTVRSPNTDPITKPELFTYDAVFLARGPAIDNQWLLDFVDSGGNVMIAGGADTDLSNLETPLLWNAFLNPLGIPFFNAINGVDEVASVNSNHPVFLGVDQVYTQSTVPIHELDPDDIRTEVIMRYEGADEVHGMPNFWAAYESLVRDITLSGSALFDGLPLPNPDSILWELVDGPAFAPIAQPGQFETTARITQPGVYTFRLTVGLGGDVAQDEVAVEVFINDAPVVDAGPNRSVRNTGEAITLNGLVLDDGQPDNAALSVTWTELDGPGLANFTAPGTAVTDVSFDTAGIYLLELSADDTSSLTRDFIEVRVSVLSSIEEPVGLAAWWSGNGSVREVVSNHSPIVEPTITPTFVTAQVSQGFSFDGVNDFMRIPAHPDLDVGAGGGFSLEFWAQPVDDTRIEGLFVWGDELETGVQIFIHSPDGNIFVDLKDNVLGQTNIVSANNILSTTEFRHVVITYDRASGLLSFFSNGQLINFVVAGVRDLRTESDIFIGRAPNDNRFYNGVLDEISLYNIAISADLVNEIYQAGIAGKAPADLNEAPIVDAGPDIPIRNTSELVALNGSASDDGLPAGIGLEVDWNVLAGPGLVTFVPDAQSAQTSASFDTPGIYLLELTANDSVIESGDVIEVRAASFCTVNDPPGLVSWWPGNLNGSDVVGGHNLEIANDIPFAGGAVAKGFFFDGIDNLLRVPAHPDLDVGLGSGFAVEFWANPVDANQVQTILAWSDIINNGVRIFMHTPSGSLFLDMKSTAGVPTNLLTVPGALVSGEFHHLVISYDRPSGIISVFRDGALFHTIALGDVELQTSYDLYWGRMPNETRHFEGVLDELSLYNQPIDSELAAALYQSGAVGKCPIDDNNPPLLDAGPDLTVSNTNVAESLDGFVADDGLPEGIALNVRWQALNDPGSVVFGDDTQPSTTVTFTDPGLYLLELSADDAAFAVTDTTDARVALACPAIDTSTLTAWWPGNSNPNDTIGGNTASLSGVTFVPGHVLNAFSFDGIDDFMLIAPDPGIDLGANSNGFSMEFWARATDDQHTGALFTWSSGSGYRVRIYSHAPNGSIFIELHYVGGGSTVIFTTDDLFSTNEYRHIALTYDRVAGIFDIYRNGQIFDSRSIGSHQVDTRDSLYIGEQPGDSRHYFGDVDELAFYNRALTQAEVDSIYQVGTAGKCAPVINTTPQVLAGADQTIDLPAIQTTLNGVIIDDGLDLATPVIVWSQLSGPAATIDSPSSAQTQVTLSVIGTYLFQLSADDGEFTIVDTISVELRAVPNQPPAVEAGPDQTVALAVGADLAGSAIDDGLINPVPTFLWTKVSGLGSILVDDPNDPLTHIDFTLPGVYVLRLTADDGELSGNDTLSITVFSGPVVSITTPIDGSNFEVNSGPITLTASAVDQDGVITSVGFFEATDGSLGNGAQVPGTNNYTLDITAPPVARLMTLTAVATDNEGFTTTSAPVTIVISPVGGFTNPVAVIDSPLEDSLITVPTPIVGTADSSIIKEYKLDRRLKGTTQWITFAQGTSPVISGELGVFDPTLLRNGIYEVRLTVTDLVGQSITDGANGEISYAVDGSMKVGHFSLSFEDLSVPVSGLPIQVIRTYDSRDKELGAFGFGWTLGIRNIRLQRNRPLNTNWFQDVPQGGSPFEQVCTSSIKEKTVTVTFPDDTQHRFRLEVVVNPVGSPRNCQFVVPVTLFETREVDWVPLDDSQGTLVTVDSNNNPDNLVHILGTGPTGLARDEFGFDPYNPFRFKYTSPEGDEFILEEETGLLSMTDRNGNTLTISDSGIIHSAGKSITFNRDGQGRIASIQDPNGNFLFYAYDPVTGDLESFTNRESEVTTYTYHDPVSTGLPPHTLDEIFDPRGIRATRTEYDADGRMIRQIDPDGNTIEFEHDIDGRIEIIRDRLGNPTTHIYDERGNVLATTDALNNTTTFTYDANDNELTRTDALSNATTKTFDSSNNLLTETVEFTDEFGALQQATTTFTYDSFRNPLTITDAINNPTTFSYDSNNGNLTSQEDAENNTTTFTYDPGGNLDTITDAEGNVTDNDYDASGNLISTIVLDSTSVVLSDTSFTYDTNGNQLTQTVVRTLPDSSTENILTTFEYDNENRLTKTIFNDSTFTETTYNAIGKEATARDQLGRMTSFDYDDRGNLTKTTFPDLTTEESVYDLENRRIASIDRLGRTTYSLYDAVGRLTETIFPDATMPAAVLTSEFDILNAPELADNPSTFSAYDEIGRVIAQTDESGNTTTFEYDPNCGCSNRRTRVIDALLNETTFVYDANGNQVSVTDANLHTTTFTYDDNSRPTVTTFSDTTTTVTEYDGLGRRTAQIDQEDNRTDFVYDGLGRLVEVIQPAPTVSDPRPSTQYAYDEAGNQISQIDAENRETKFEFDSLGRRTKRILPALQEETFIYEDAGNLTSKTDFNGNTTTFTYDSLSRLLTETPDPIAFPSAATIVYTYTDTGQRSSMTDESGVTTYIYDERDRLFSKATPDGTLSYTYDPGGNLTSTQSSNFNGVDVSYTYDSLNRLDTVEDNNFVPPGVSTYGYDLVGNLKTVTYHNGVTHTWAYDNRNRLTGLLVTDSGSLSIANYQYTLDQVGNRTQVVELSGRTVDYTYDNLYRLTNELIGNDPSGPVGDVSYTYDAVGNRLDRASTLLGINNQTFTYDNNDRISGDIFDDNGNTVQSDGNIDEYDFKNRLVKRTKSDGTVIRLAYDGDGNRVGKTVTPSAGSPVTTKFLVDRNNLTGFAQVLEEIEAGVVKRVYTYGLDLISVDQEIAGQFELSFYVYDGLGSVRALTDTSSLVTDSYDYDAFGNVLDQTGSNTPNSYLFTGEQFDSDLGLYFLRARYLNAETGRFHTIDRFEGRNLDPISLHKYLYANANPVNLVDPSGNLSTAEILFTVSVVGTLTKLAVPRILRATLGNKVFEQYSECVTSFIDKYYNLGGINVVDKIDDFEAFSLIGSSSMLFSDIVAPRVSSKTLSEKLLIGRKEA